ncbi:MAG: hypothetical protein ACE37F_19265 [Nannocystaceae bacterium]|nr:hypothetical protein [bacterium]
MNDPTSVSPDEEPPEPDEPTPLVDVDVAVDVVASVVGDDGSGTELVEPAPDVDASIDVEPSPPEAETAGPQPTKNERSQARLTPH